jgi:hypothetical protein
MPKSTIKSPAQSPATSHRTTLKPGIAKLQNIGKSKKKKDCNPPYTIDPSGIRRIKDECF